MSDFFQLSADEQAERLGWLAVNALAEWGVRDCEPRLIKYRENAVFEVKTAGGEPAALRVHRQGYHDDASLASELAWMAMLAENGLVVPQPVLSDAGTVVVNATAEGVPGEWKVDMLAWLAGRQLGAVGEALDLAGRDTAGLFTAIGETIGTLHNLTTAWPGQNTMSRAAWDKDGFVGEAPLWGCFWELAALTAEQKALFLRARAAIAEDLAAYGQTAANYGMIHADLVPENVMLDGDEIQLIDFDDAGFGWHMFELVTAIYWLVEEPEYVTIRDSLLAGYQRVRPLLQRDLAMMDTFFAARSLTYLGWVHTRRNAEAEELTPVVVEIAKGVCGRYLSGRG